MFKKSTKYLICEYTFNVRIPRLVCNSLDEAEMWVVFFKKMFPRWFGPTWEIDKIDYTGTP